MNRTVISFLLILISITTTTAQEILHRWKPLQNEMAKKIWYDVRMLDNATDGENFEVWILEEHNPPLIFKEVDGEVYKSKILFTINLKTVKYGIMQVIYYNTINEKLYSFTYPIANFPDKYKYTYQIMKDNFLFNIVKEFIKAEKNKQMINEKTNK